MYAMCHTKSDDVTACIKEMLKRGIKYPILQVGQKLYARCYKDHSKAMEIARNKKRHFVINMITKIIHKKGCSIAQRIKPNCVVEAYLVRPKDTGLTMCKKCMK